VGTLSLVLVLIMDCMKICEEWEDVAYVRCKYTPALSVV